MMNRRDYLRNIGTVSVVQLPLDSREKFQESIGPYELIQRYEDKPRPFIALYRTRDRKKRISIEETEMGRYRLSMLEVDTDSSTTKTAGWYHHDLDRIREKLKQWCHNY